MTVGSKSAKANLNPVRQRTQYTCMSTSMCMALNALGHECDEDEVNKVMGARPMKGAAWEQALACAQHYGVRGTLVCPSTVNQLKEWCDAGKPVMIAWNPEGREWSHASVVFDVTEDPEHGLMVHVADPNIPDPDETVRVVPKSEFYQKWYEKWPDYLVRRPALMLDREITQDGRQVMASRKKQAAKKLRKVRSLQELYRKAKTDSGYMHLLKLAAENLGHYGSENFDAWVRTLENNALESGDSGMIVDEVNFVLDIAQDDLDAGRVKSAGAVKDFLLSVQEEVEEISGEWPDDDQFMDWAFSGEADRYVLKRDPVGAARAYLRQTKRASAKRVAELAMMQLTDEEVAYGGNPWSSRGTYRSKGLSKKIGAVLKAVEKMEKQLEDSGEMYDFNYRSRVPRDFEDSKKALKALLKSLRDEGL